MDELRATYNLVPALPFDDPRVWPLVDTLFLAGRLRPFVVPPRWSIQPPYTIGVTHAGAADQAARGQQLADTLLSRCPQADSPALEWLSLAPLIGELMALQHTSDEHLYLTDTLQHLRTAFASWMQTRYAALQTTAPFPVPQLVSHIAHGLAGERSRGKLKQVLIVLDGMALDQWVVIREVWSEQNQPLLWDERAVFAWVPTLTHISRQAIFAGKPPSSFAASINRTNREEHHWKSFWQSCGLHASSVVLLKGLQGVDSQRTASELHELEELLATPAVQVIGIVVDTIDKIAHGMQLGEAGMAQQVRQWANGGWLANLVQRLHTSGYHVTLTADHGNVAVRGIGRVADGILAEERGVRARVYSDPLLRDRTVNAIPGAIAWPGAGLPPTISAALAPPGSAFTTEGQYLVAHGGIDLREVMVPCISLRPADRDESH